MVTLAELNAQPVSEVEIGFLDCCGSRAWAAAMASRRPFASIAEVHEAADAQLDRLERKDWLQAFGAHPRIGDSSPAASDTAATHAWASGEQSGMHDADQVIRNRLAAGNDAYFERFGYIFLICATGKSAEEMLAALEFRLASDPEDELAIAAEEQRLITHLRLDKLLEP